MFLVVSRSDVRFDLDQLFLALEKSGAQKEIYPLLSLCSLYSTQQIKIQVLWIKNAKENQARRNKKKFMEWGWEIRYGSWTAATFKMKLFMTRVNGLQTLTIATKSSIFDLAAVLDRLRKLSKNVGQFVQKIFQLKSFKMFRYKYLIGWVMQIPNINRYLFSICRVNSQSLQIFQLTASLEFKVQAFGFLILVDR